LDIACRQDNEDFQSSWKKIRESAGLNWNDNPKVNTSRAMQSVYNVYSRHHEDELMRTFPQR